MNPPTLSLGATVVSLPHPATATAPGVSVDERKVQRRTIGGRLRTTLLSWGHVYQLSFAAAPLATWQAIRDLWVAAMAAGQYPTFDYQDAWPEANGVSVAVELGQQTAWGSADPTLVNFSLSLQESDPR